VKWLAYDAEGLLHRLYVTSPGQLEVGCLRESYQVPPAELARRELG
jgi:hypothetical protein